MLTADEFAAEINDPRIDKYLAYQGDTVVGITTVAADIRAVPWIESAFYLTRFPDVADRGALFHLMFALVDPQALTFGVFKDMMDAVCRRFVPTRAVVGNCRHRPDG